MVEPLLITAPFLNWSSKPAPSVADLSETCYLWRHHSKHLTASTASRPPRYALRRDNGAPTLWYNGEVGVDEPDCSPYPFDVMAIHALYQSVP